VSDTNGNQPDSNNSRKPPEGGVPPLKGGDANPRAMPDGDDGEWRLEPGVEAKAMNAQQSPEPEPAKPAGENKLAKGAKVLGRYVRSRNSISRDFFASIVRILRAGASELQSALVALGAGFMRLLGLARGAVATTKLPGVDVARDPKANPLKRLAVVGGYASASIFAVILGFFVYVTWGMPSTDDLWAARQSPSITILDRNGRVLLREGAQNAPPVELAALPAYVGQAIIAIEDKRFKNHIGVDVEGLTRAIWENVRARRVVQGGSTLTQQLAKNLFLTNERTFRRKAQEVAMALWLESRFTKDEILALYLSRVFFGAGAWGIEAASERYFDKPARELALGEAALLAGLLKAPSRMNPANEATAAKARQLVVLNEMMADGYITEAQRNLARDTPLNISRKNPSGNLGYFRDWIDPLLNQVIGDQRDDFIIETTLDLDAQRAGERALVAALDEQGKPMGVSQGALFSIDSTGGVRAMVGGRGYADSQFNRTTQARRQPGSAFKYYIYMAAMQEGISPNTYRNDAPVVIGDWAPGNYENEYFGSVPLTFAFAKSLNMVAIQLANEVGGKKVIEMARDLGVRTRLQDYRSLALGAQEMTLLEVTQSYAAMTNSGAPVQPHGVNRVRRASGNVIWSWRAPRNQPVVNERTIRAMNLLMSRVVQAGTGTRARIDGRDVAGKTGTGNDYRDAWFIGFTGGLTTGVWVGNDNFVATKKVTGGSIPARVWHDYMLVALRNEPKIPLVMPTPDDFPMQFDAITAVEALPERPDVVGAPLLPASNDNAGPAIDAAPSLDGPQG
jgi:penicillin-binding protein 1A